MEESNTNKVKKIACQQVLLQDSSVFSIQWMVFPPNLAMSLTPEHMLNRYLHYVQAFTLSLIKPFIAPHKVEFRLLRSQISLISFTGPDFDSDEKSTRLTLRISGGILVQRDNCSRGDLSFITKHSRYGIKAILQLSDYCPLLLGNNRPSQLRKTLYRFTQAYIHRIVTVKFLSRLYREMAGIEQPIKMVRVKVKNGEEI